MKLIAVISHKGGAGKTTTAVLLAEELARRGQRTLLVDADRQQGAGLLLGIDSPAGCVQHTMVPQLDYLGSARLTDLEVADCFASVADRFDIGIVDTPSLDDPLARAWLREAAATLMVLQVDPLTVKTLPSALNTLEVVRAFKPTIQLLGLLPTMFNQEEETHRSLLTELLSRRPEAVFTPVVPADPGLMHRASGEDSPRVGEAAQQAFQCAVDRILRSLETAAPSVTMPRTARTGQEATGRPAPPWAQQPGPIPTTPAASVPPAGSNPLLGAKTAPVGEPYLTSPAAGPGGGAPPVPWSQDQSLGAPATAAYAAPPSPGDSNWARTPSSGLAPAAMAGDPVHGSALPMGAGGPQSGTGPVSGQSPAWQGEESGAAAGGAVAARPGARLQVPEGVGAWDDQSIGMSGSGDAALETLASAPQSMGRETTARLERDPEWWRQQNVRVDEGGVVRRGEPWLVRARFAIACTVACLALIAAILMGTLRNRPVDSTSRVAAGKGVSAAHAEPRDGKGAKVNTAGKASGKARRKESAAARPEGKGERKP